MSAILKFLLRIPLRLFLWKSGKNTHLRWRRILLAVAALGGFGGVNAYIMPEWLGTVITSVTGVPMTTERNAAPGPSVAAGFAPGTRDGGADTTRTDYNPPADFNGGTAPALSPRLFAAFADPGLGGEQLARLPDSPHPLAAKPADAPWRQLSRVLDGDTVIVDNRKVRLIGIDCPESTDNDRLHSELSRIGRGGDSATMLTMGQAAAAFTRQVAEGKRCWLEYDGATTDQYGRILAYVHLEDGVNLNEALIYNGYAKTYMPASFRYMKRYLYLQNEAQRLGHGLWTRTR